jgi:HKD family nuclease
MRALTERSVEFSIATAFITTGAVDDLIGSAIRAGARVRLLTGTFGNNTRQSTFRRLLTLANDNAIQARIWSSERHGDLHAKLYLWALTKKRGAAWIGSANFTDGGLQKEGELVLEVRSSWQSPMLRRLRVAFEAEWARGTPLNAEFVDRYRESPRSPPDASIKRMRRHVRSTADPIGAHRCLTAYVSMHYEEGGRAEKRVTTLLGGTASEWVRLSHPQAGRVKAGDRLLLVDLVDHTVVLGTVVDAVTDGKARVLAFEPISGDSAWQRWSPALRSRVAKAGGFRPRGPALGTQWLTPDRARSIVAEIYPGKRRHK